MTEKARRELGIIHDIYPNWMPTSKTKPEQQIHAFAQRVIQSRKQCPGQTKLFRETEKAPKQLNLFDQMGPKTSSYAYLRATILDESKLY